LAQMRAKKKGAEPTRAGELGTAEESVMNYYSGNQKRKKHRRRKPTGLYALIGVLSAVLLILVLVLILYKGPKIALHPELTMEAGGAIPAPEKFLAEETNAKIAYSNTSAVLTNEPGVYDVKLICNEQEYTAKIRVVDTVAPTGTVKELSAMGHQMPKAEDFVVSIQDATKVTVSYLEEPKDDQDGEQTVTIVLKDAAGNTTQLPAKLTLTIDRTPPVITGVTDKTIYLGDSISYKDGIAVDGRKVKDDLNPDYTFVVNNDNVDLTKVGEYTVIYTATDAAGNTTVVEAKIKVLEKKDYYVPYDVIYQEVDAILAQIIRDDMTLQNKVWAIYKWIRENNAYVNHSDKEDWMQAAYLMMTEHKGDCFNYYSLCKLMLDRLGIPNIDVRKVKNYEGDNDHYWSLVSLDGGNTWYHVDTTPRTNPASFCLVTDKFMDDYSAANGKCFNRDKSLYPATPEEEL